MSAWRIMRAAAPLGLIACAAIASTASGQARRDSLTFYEFPDYRGASVTFYGDNANIGSTGFTTRAQSAQVIGSWRVCSGGGYRNRCEVLERNVRDLTAYGLSRQVGSAQRLSGQAYAAPAPVPAPPAAQPYIRPYAEAPAYPPPRMETRPLAPAQGYQPDPRYPAPYPDSRSEAPYDPRYSDPRRGFGAPYRPDFGPPAADAPIANYPAPYAADPYPAPTYPPQPYPAQTYPPAEASYAPGGVSGETSVFFAQPMVRGMEVSADGVRAADGFCRGQGLGLSLYFDASRRAGRSATVDGRVTGPGPVLRDVLCRR